MLLTRIRNNLKLDKERLAKKFLVAVFELQVELINLAAWLNKREHIDLNVLAESFDTAIHFPVDFNEDVVDDHFAISKAGS